jgi:RNA polymerase sigma-70 factor, ECF subfamily
MRNSSVLTSREIEVLFNESVNYYSFVKGLNRMDVEEVVSKALNKAMTTFELDKGAAFKTWYMVIVRNSIVDYVRKVRSNKYTTVSLSEVMVDEDGKEDQRYVLVDSAMLVDEKMEIEESFNGVVETMDKIVNEQQKTMLFKFYVDGMKYREIADEMGINIETVKVNIFRGRQSLIKNYKTGK